MPKKTDYRIMLYQKEGYYTYYMVQKKTLWFWSDVSRAFDHIHQARSWIEDQLVVQTRTVVE